MTVRPSVVRVLAAVLGALAAHALLALAFAACLGSARRPDVSALLVLSSVELSFAETVDESAPAEPVLSTPASAHRPPRPKVAEEPPAASVGSPMPPERGEVKLREPQEDARLGEEDARRATHVARSPAAAPQQARVDAPPHPLRSIRPDYPKGARRRGEQGETLLELCVNADGVVDSVRIVRSSGFAELDRAAVRAAQAARFAPARSGESAVASTVRLPLRFKLK